jgi:glycerophosphoryl diester phosphodiesterase
VSYQPLLLGHRGCRRNKLKVQAAAHPAENSLAAFEYALAQGCDGFEFDVRHTRDGNNVLWHDPDWHGKQIAATSYVDLVDRDGGRLAALDEVLTHFGKRAYLDIELKEPGSEEAIVAALRASPAERGFIVSSFFPEILLRLRELAGDLPLGFICDRKDALNIWRELPIEVILPRHDFVRPPLIDDIHKHGKRIITWTVNSPRQIRQFSNWGVDGLISDDPQLLCQTIHTE